MRQFTCSPCWKAYRPLTFPIVKHIGNRSRFAVAGYRLKNSMSWDFLLQVGSEKRKQGVETNIQMFQGLHKFAEKNRKL
jgi:hypothetical protein